jgi:4-amino-4-deoxy-L-arabinose transferase-like glycosyltransferase
MPGTRAIGRAARRLITHPYFYIFLAAALLRLVLFALALDQAGSVAQLQRVPPDARLYSAAADAIRIDLNFQTHGVRAFGPGYPILLALMGGLVGTSPGALIPLQILLTALGSVLLAMLAFRLTKNRRIAVITGFLNALSLTGAGLANVLISDSLFFVLFVIGLLLFVRGLDDGRQRWWWLSGLVLGFSVLTRSVAMFSPAIIAVLAITYVVPEQERWRSLIRRRVIPFAITVFCFLVVACAWVIRNHQVHGVTYLSWAGPNAMARLAATVGADVNRISFEEASQQFGEAVAERTGVTGNAHQAYAEVAREMFFEAILHHPLSTLKTYLRQLDEGVHSDWSPLGSILPDWAQPIRTGTRWVERLGLSFRVTILSALGFLLLYRQKRRRLALSLAFIYVYFALLAGFTSLQGNRVFYPGQIAWSMLVAVALLWLYESIRKRGRGDSSSAPQRIV